MCFSAIVSYKNDLSKFVPPIEKAHQLNFPLLFCQTTRNGVLSIFLESIQYKHYYQTVDEAPTTMNVALLFVRH